PSCWWQSPSSRRRSACPPARSPPSACRPAASPACWSGRRCAANRPSHRRQPANRPTPRLGTGALTAVPRPSSPPPPAPPPRCARVAASLREIAVPFRVPMGIPLVGASTRSLVELLACRGERYSGTIPLLSVHPWRCPDDVVERLHYTLAGPTQGRGPGRGPAAVGALFPPTGGRGAPEAARSTGARRL